MIPVDLGTLLALAAGAGLAAVLGVWSWLDRREALLVDPRRLRSSFACTSCGRVYTRGRAREEAPCPGCGANNVRLRL